MDPLAVPMRSMENQLLNYQLGGFDGRLQLGAGGTEVAPSCPRCASPNTKFCYYNNYSLSQPRYFCKSCRRYWTRGGSLRNVPVGGGCRKSRRSRAARAAKVDSSPLTPPNSNSNSSSSDDNLKSDAPEIDLAMVFAKFLNPSTGHDDPELDPLNCIDRESSSEVMPGDVFDPLTFLPQGSAAGMQPVRGGGEFFMGNELDALGLVPANVLAEGDLHQAMPEDDGPWLDREPSMVDFSWQQEASPSDDSWMISSVADSWNSTLDYSGFEILSSP